MSGRLKPTTDPPIEKSQSSGTVSSRFLGKEEQRGLTTVTPRSDGRALPQRDRQDRAESPTSPTSEARGLPQRSAEEASEDFTA